MKQLFAHQQKIIDDDPKKCGLFLGTGGGKTLTALSLAKGKTLVICPKTTSLDSTWTKDGHDVTVISKEKFRSDHEWLLRYDTVIIDEAHTVSGVQPTIVHKNKQPRPKTSQLFDACVSYIKENKPDRLYLLTATPVRNPMAVYALATLLGKDWNFHQFRDTFYIPVRMGFKEIWMPKKDTATQERLGKAVQKLGYTGKLDDWVDLPEQTHKIINIPLSKEQTSKLRELPLDFPDPLVLVMKKHQVEQGVLKGDEYNKSETFPTGKLEAIEDLYEEFGKILVFAKYTEQIDQIKDHFKGEEVYTLDGRTKDRGKVIDSANSATRCIVVAQSGVSAGYELPSFRCTIFASMDYSYVNLNQAWGRTLRINNLQKNLYVYLLSGEIDKAVYKSVAINKEDFQIAIYEKN